MIVSDKTILCPHPDRSLLTADSITTLHPSPELTEAGDCCGWLAELWSYDPGSSDIFTLVTSDQ